MELDRRSFLGGVIGTIISMPTLSQLSGTILAEKLSSFSLRLMNGNVQVLPPVPITVGKQLESRFGHYIYATWSFKHTTSKIKATHAEAVDRDGLVFARHNISDRNRDWLYRITFATGETLTIDTEAVFD